MTGGEIEQPCLRRQLGPTTQPGIEQVGPTTDAGLQQQGRQGKVVGQMRMVNYGKLSKQHIVTKMILTVLLSERETQVIV